MHLSMKTKTPIRVAHIMGKMVGGGVESTVMNYYENIDRKLIQYDFFVDSDSTIIPTKIERLGGKIFFYLHIKNKLNIKEN